MTMITEVFGIRGDAGDLVIRPKLLKKQFDSKGIASIKCRFAEKNLEVIFKNPDGMEYVAFSSQSHFIQSFKKLIGITPKKYRDHYYRTSW